MKDPSFVVGIDLGTTNTVLAFTDPSRDEAPRIFEVPRLVAQNRVGTRTTLPSALYAPLPSEIADDPDFIVGDFAVTRSRELSGRTILSAKSWLCHSRIDRRAPILPYAADSLSERLSPVAATARILEKLTLEWDRAFPTRPLAQQQVVLTVPASFDPVARQLTLAAAAQVGLQVRLLEEPQAAFYDYLAREGTGALEGLLGPLRTQVTALVCDVGGGTTDLTLVKIHKSQSGALQIDRVAVGRHLLLGGDNMDLALAHRLEARLSSGSSLPPARFAELVQACRAAKERLFADPAKSELFVSIAGSGSSLVGNTLSISLSQADLVEVIVEGFFPSANPEQPVRRSRSALVGFGLPYEPEPGITRHVAAFLARHLGAEPRVDALLTNGGVFLSNALVTRLCLAVPALSHPELRLLPQPHPELAVARGAVAYGCSLLGRGLRIGGGSSHGYYVGIEGPSGPRSAICVVPRGGREEEIFRAEGLPLSLKIGAPVRFELYAADSGPVHAPGQTVALDDNYELLPPIISHLAADAKPRTVPVLLEGTLSAVGTLVLGCVSLPTSTELPQRFELVFELRGQEAELGGSPRASERPQGEPARRGDGGALGGRFELVDAAVQRVFGKGRGDVPDREVRDLLRTLERHLGPRRDWTLEVSRRLFNVVGPKHKARLRSFDHERVYWQLTGFAGRPGFGHALDRGRLELILSLLDAGLAFPDQIRSWQQLFIAHRRLAPGLGEAAQLRFFERYGVFVAPSSVRTKRPRGPAPLAEPELIDCLSWLERLSVAHRVELGEWLLERSFARPDPLLWLAIGRIGARVPVYASLHHVIPVHSVESWLSHLLRERLEQLPTAAEAACMLARQTGDRTRDVTPSLRLELLGRLTRTGAPDRFLMPLRELLPIEEGDRTEQFGEELPVGLSWLDRDSD